jgi:hypothetical protein
VVDVAAVTSFAVVVAVAVRNRLQVGWEEEE